MCTRVSCLGTTRTDLYFDLDDGEYLGTERLHQFQQSLQTVRKLTFVHFSVFSLPNDSPSHVSTTRGALENDSLRLFYAKNSVNIGVRTLGLTPCVWPASVRSWALGMASL